jgi:hypothetical protein
MGAKFHWLEHLQDQSYMIIERFILDTFTVILGTDYGTHARAIDLRETPSAQEDDLWLPLCTIDCWSDLPLQAGIEEEVWPRLGKAANSQLDWPGVPLTVAGITDYSKLEHQETSGQRLRMKSIEELEMASTTEDMKMVNLVKRRLSTRELTLEVADDGRGTFAAHSA